MVTNLFRSTTTLINPFFGMKNAVADIMTSTLQGQKATYTEAIRGYVGAMIEAFQYQFGGKIRAGSELNQFAYMGGLEGDAYSHDVESARKKLQDVFREDYVKERGKLRALWETGVGAVEKFNDAIESGMRYYQFRQGLKTGQSMQRAFRMSQEATVDFSKTGFKTKEVAQFFYFLNANVQDTYGIWHMIEQNQFEPGRATRMMARTIVRATVMNMAWEIMRRLFWSDEDKEKYNAAADNVKAENYILGYVGDTAIMLPKVEIPVMNQPGMFKPLDEPAALIAARMARAGTKRARKPIACPPNMFGIHILRVSPCSARRSAQRLRKTSRE